MVAAVAVLAACGVVAALSSTRQSQLQAAIRTTVLYPFTSLHSFAAERGRVAARNRVLAAERDSLAKLVTHYRSLVREVRDLSSVAGITTRTGSTVVAALQPGRPRIGDPTVFELAGPGLDGGSYPSGVFTGTGLVGVARALYGDVARGEFWSHIDFRVSVVTEDGSVSGIARPIYPQAGQAVLLLEGAPFRADIPDGTALVTSGVTGIYPRGIPVGRVREPWAGEAAWMKRYLVEPAVRPGEVGGVLVWVPSAAPASDDPAG